MRFSSAISNGSKNPGMTSSPDSFQRLVISSKSILRKRHPRGFKLIEFDHVCSVYLRVRKLLLPAHRILFALPYLRQANFFVPLPIWLTDSTMYFFCENQLRANSHEHCVQLSPLGAMPRLWHTFVGRDECR